MKNYFLKSPVFHIVVFIFSILFSMDSNASFSTFKFNTLEKPKGLLSFPKIDENDFIARKNIVTFFTFKSNILPDIYSSYKSAFEYFHKGNPVAAINELNTNCIPYIESTNQFIYKAYKLLMACYKGIDKDGNAQEKLNDLCATVHKDRNTVQGILDNTVL